MTLTVTSAPHTQSLVTRVSSSASYLPAPLVASSHRPPVLPDLVPDLSQKVIAFTLPQLLILIIYPRPCPQSSHCGVTAPCPLFSECTLALTPGYCAVTVPASASQHSSPVASVLSLSRRFHIRLTNPSLTPHGFAGFSLPSPSSPPKQRCFEGEWS